MDSELLLAFLVRVRVARVVKEKYAVKPLELAVLAYISVGVVGCTRRQIMNAGLGTERNVQDAVKSVADKGLTEYYLLGSRAARRMRLTERGRAVIGELTRQIRRHTRVLERGM